MQAKAILVDGQLNGEAFNWMFERLASLHESLGLDNEIAEAEMRRMCMLIRLAKLLVALKLVEVSTGEKLLKEVSEC